MKLVLLYVLFLVLFLGVATFREGFDLGTSFQAATGSSPSIGEYDYLKPHDPTVLDATTESDFTTAFNTTTTFAPNLNLTTNTSMLPSFKKAATLEEFQYYIKNNKWPYGSYLTNYMTTNKDATLKAFSWLKLSSTEEVQEVMPSRTVYEMLINPVESKQTPPPPSNDVFTGKTSVSPSASASSLSPEDFTKLKSICSSIA
jgi:hypothetical protein